MTARAKPLRVLGEGRLVDEMGGLRMRSRILDHPAPKPSTESADPFVDVVVRDAKDQATAEEASMLRRPENAERWASELRGLMQDLDAQFANKKAANQEVRNRETNLGVPQRWYDHLAEYERWRAGATRFKASVQQRLAEAKPLVQGSRDRSDREAPVGLLRECEAFLDREENIAYSAMPDRDDLLEAIRDFFRK